MGRGSGAVERSKQTDEIAGMEPGLIMLMHLVTSTTTCHLLLLLLTEYYTSTSTPTTLLLLLATLTSPDVRPLEARQLVVQDRSYEL